MSAADIHSHETEVDGTEAISDSKVRKRAGGSETVHVALGSLSTVCSRIHHDTVTGSHIGHKSAPPVDN
ncbi:hypothetical protein TNCV_199931 [Trichonephila clavipes]|nr:hypothetical protein TNCV_199931 [Trichonephila clavipes]